MPELPQQFTLTIELGNDAMQTPYDVQAALDKVAKTLLTTGCGYPDYKGLREWDGKTEGTIMDINGNSVGKWEVHPTAHERWKSVTPEEQGRHGY